MNTNLIILGSSHSEGNTKKVVDELLHSLEGEVVDLNKLNISYFDYEHRNRNDDFLPLAEKMTQAQTIILATPIYWYSMSAIMKTFLDRWSDLLKIRKDLGRQMRGKRLFVIACSSDATEYAHFDLPFERTADYMGMIYLGYVHTWIEQGKVPELVKEKLAMASKKIGSS